MSASDEGWFQTYDQPNLMESWLRNLRDVGDVLKHARNPAELAKGLMPNRWLSRRILNGGKATGGERDASQLAEDLRAIRNELNVEAIDDDGKVDYVGLRQSQTFARMGQTSLYLRTIDLATLSDDDARGAFWINIYNVLAIHAVLALEIRKSVMEVPSFFGTVAYHIGGFVLTLDEIENGVLRRNARHPATGLPPFSADDPRLSLCPTTVDPRIHAALVCASASCPPVAFYDASKLDAQLDSAASNYVAADVEVDDAKRVVRLPITFRYYQSDFGGVAGIRSFLLRHSMNAHHTALEAAFDADFGLDYHRYDWSLNSIV